MPFLTVIIAFFFLFWSWALSLRLFLKKKFPLSECRINFLIYFVRVSPRLSLKIDILIVSFIFLRSFSEIVVETCDYRD
jgi:hypothetical protein